MYKIWINNWNFTEYQILLIAEYVHKQGYSIPYLNKILSTLNNKNIKTDDEIEKYLKNNLSSNRTITTEKSAGFMTREYTKEQLSALYDSLDDVEI